MARLTPRERQIASLLASGIKPIDIANRLVISRRTVYNHMKSARDKTDATSTLDLVVRMVVESQR